MAMETTKLLLVVMAVMMAVAQGQNSNCTNLVTDLTPCLPFLLPGNTSAPDALCCTPLATLLNSSSADCFCSFTSFSSLVNISRAPEIAASCNTTIPPSVLACFNSTTTAPSPSPSKSPSTPSTPSPPGSNSSSSGGSGSGSNDGFAVSPTRNFVIWALVVGVGGVILA